jgi:hypothetical protein
MKQTTNKVYAVIDGIVTGIIAFDNKADADAWAQQNQKGGEALSYSVIEVPVYPNLAAAPKNPEFF